MQNVVVPEEHSANKALLWSLIPGGGQIYNDQAWKVPIIYGAFAGMGYAIHYNYTRMVKFSDANYLLLDETELEYVDAGASTYYDELLLLREALPGAVIEYNVDLGGTIVSSTDRSAVLEAGNTITPEELAERLRWLPGLEQLDIMALDWPNEDSFALAEQFPELKTVWPVHFYDYVVPSNITCFSTLPRTGFRGPGLEPLFTYCTDLAALDVGHQAIDSLEPLRHLKKLRVLIVADCHLSDLSPLEDLPDLEYLEIFLNDGIRDFSPLGSLTHLKDLNVSYCHYFNNIDFIKTMPELEMAWFTQRADRLTQAQMDEAVAMHPDCTFLFRSGQQSTGNGWREAERNIEIRRAFTNWRDVEDFVSWDNVRYREGAELIPVGPKFY